MPNPTAPELEGASPTFDDETCILLSRTDATRHVRHADECREQFPACLQFTEPPVPNAPVSLLERSRPAYL